jgi:two-component system chemotaxis response regulator CheY
MRQCLVVDDSRLVRSVARRLCEELRFATGEAESGAAALEACRAQMPDLILLDEALAMSGAEFIESLRRQPGGRHPVVLLCTQGARDGASSHTKFLARQAGADDFLAKPFDGRSLKAKLAQIGL